MSPSIERPFHLLIPLALLAACAPKGDFAQRMESLRARTGALVATADRCADDLRALADRDPETVRRALDYQSGTGSLGFVPPSSAHQGSDMREQIDRRAGGARAALAVIANALEVGPAALDRVLVATDHSRAMSRSLCEARDTARTIALMTHERTFREGEAVSAAR